MCSLLFYFAPKNKFSKTLSIFSMHWSGSFSREECLALSQILAEEDTPDVVSMGSFKCAADIGSLALASECPRRWNKEFKRTMTRHTGNVQHNDGGGEGCKVSCSRQDRERREGGGDGELSVDCMWGVVSYVLRRITLNVISITSQILLCPRVGAQQNGSCTNTGENPIFSRPRTQEHGDLMRRHALFKSGDCSPRLVAALEC